MKLTKARLAVRALNARVATHLKKLDEAVDARDRFFFAGLAMLGYGANSVYPAAGWIVAGVVLTWVGLRGR